MTSADPFEQFTLGGLPPAMIDPALFSQRIAMPALPSGIAEGNDLLSYRIDVPIGVTPYLWGGRAWDHGDVSAWHRVAGVEWGGELPMFPVLGTPAVRGTFGVGRSLDSAVRASHASLRDHHLRRLAIASHGRRRFAADRSPLRRYLRPRSRVRSAEGSDFRFSPGGGTMTVTRRAGPWLFVAALAAPAALYGQGFGLNEIGSCAIARGFANTGAPCQDASTIYWNPAAATELSGWSVLFGAASIAVKGSFTRDTIGTKYNADPPTSIVPNVFLNYRAAGSKLAWGLGVYVPYGLTSQWGSDFPGRFISQKASIQSIYIQPNVAYQINDKWSIGGGPIVGRSSVDLQQGLDASAQPVPGTPFTLGQLGIPEYTEFAQAQLKGNSIGYGAQIGLAGKLTPQWSFGARFLSPIWFKYSNANATFSPVATNLSLAANNPFGPGGTSLPAGTPLDALFASQFAAGGALVSQTASTTIVDPAQFEAGVGYTGFKDWLFDVDYDWVGWGQLKAININFANNPLTPNESIIMDYKNTSGVRIGAERVARRRSGEDPRRASSHRIIPARAAG